MVYIPGLDLNVNRWFNVSGCVVGVLMGGRVMLTIVSTLIFEIFFYSSQHSWKYVIIVPHYSDSDSRLLKLETQFNIAVNLNLYLSCSRILLSYIHG